MADAHCPSPASPPPFGWEEFARLLSRRRRTLVWSAVLTVALTAAVMASLPTLYTAGAVVMLDQQKNSVADSSSVLSALPNDAATVQNQIQILTSRDLAGVVVDRLKLADDPEFNAALAAPGMKERLLAAFGLGGGASGDAREGAIDAFLKKLDVSALGLSTSIAVGFTATDPAKAAKIANATVDAYVEGQIDTKTEAAKKAAAWLNTRIDQLSHQLETEEFAVEAYKSAHNLVDSGQAASLIEQQLGAITTQLVTAQSELAAKQAVLQRAEALMRAGRPADLSQVVSSDLMVKLHTEEAELVKTEADYASRYGTNHPKMVAIKTQKRDLEAKIAQEAARLTGAMASDVAVAQAHLSSLQASLKQAGKASSGDNLARVTLNALQAKAASTRQMYESFVSKLRAIQDQDAIQNAESRVISHAAPPASPSAPRRALFTAAALPLGLMLGVLLALIGERLVPGQTPRTAPRREPSAFGPAQVAPATMWQPGPSPMVQSMLPPVLATVPAAGTVHAADAVLDAPSSYYAAGIAALAGRLAGPGRVSLMTAPLADPGLPVLALGLARSVARRGLGVVVIEAGEAMLLPSLGLAAPAGLSEVLAGLAAPNVALAKDRRAGVYIMPPGSGPAGQAFASRNFMELLNYFRKSGVWTLVLAPPRLAAGAGALPPCDETLLVVRAGDSQNSLTEAVRVCAAQGGKSTGLIVTR